MKRQFMIFGVLLIAFAFILAGCGDTSDSTNTEATQSGESNEASEMDATEAAVTESAATEASGSSVWTTGVIGGDIELTEVYAIGDGLIGINSMALYYSADGLVWEMTKDLNPYPFYAVFPVGNQVVVYDAGNAHTTTDGKSWTSTPREDYQLFSAVMHDGKQYIKVDTSQLYNSTDGGKFFPVQSDSTNPLTQVYFLDEANDPTSVIKLAQYGGTYYAAGAGLWSSSDLFTWTKLVTMNDITYAAEDLLYNGTVLFMPAYYENYVFDGAGITRVSPIGNVFLVNNGDFIAVSGNGASSTSSDGITWTPLFSEDTTNFTAYTSVVFKNKLFVYGEDGNYRYAELKE